MIIIELFKLIFMLFGDRPKKRNEVELMEMKHFPFKGYKYMMWCGYIIYRSSNKDKIMSEINTPIFKVSKNHEMIHLRQAVTHGRNIWLWYYIKYFFQWLLGNPFFKSAYYTIPFEVEAYANENNFYYLDTYDKNKLKRCYTFKRRRKLYKEVGNKPYAWKYYVQNIKCE